MHIHHRIRLLALAAALLGLGAYPASAQGPTTVSARGITLKSENVTIPSGSRIYPGGADATVMNANCLTCHSVGMVLTQPNLTEATWKAEVEKMRNVFKAPINQDAVPAIVAYLAKIKEAK